MSASLDFLSSETRAALEKFVDKSDVPPNARLSLEDAVEVVLSDWLMGQGYLPIPTMPGEPATNPVSVPALAVTQDTETVFGAPDK